jgi:O-antigen/teichoic acid export membrane protein
MLAGQLPVLLLTPIFGAEYVGWWSMAILLGFTPVSVIVRSIYQVMYQYTTDRVNKQLPIYVYFRRFTWIVLGLGLPFFAVLCYYMIDITTLVLGTGWEATGIYLRWMLPWVLCSLLTGSVSFLADVFFKQKVGLCFEILTSLLRTLGVVLGVVYEDFTLSIIGYSIGTAIAVAAQYIWLLGLTRQYDATLPLK